MRKSVSTYVPAPEGGGDIQGEYRDRKRKEIKRKILNFSKEKS